MKPVIQIRAERGWTPLSLGELWEFRDVLRMLAVRDVKLRYKQTLLGVVWVVLQPVLAATIFAIVFGHFAKLPSDGQPYVLFVFAGLLGWNLFSGVVQRAGNSLVAEARLLTKVYFPRLLIPIAATLAVLVDFAVSLLCLAALLVWYGRTPGTAIWLLPVALGLTLTLAVGISLWISSLNLRYRDFMYALPFLIQIWLYASPVVYSMQLIPERWHAWFALNPMVAAIEAFRAALLGGSGVKIDIVLVSASVSFAILIGGAYFFRRVERRLADWV